MRAIVGFLVARVVLAIGGCGGDDESAAEKAGVFLGEQQAKLVEGLGKGLEKNGDEAGKSLAKGGGKVLAGAGEGLAEGGEETGEKVAEGVGKVFMGVLKGLDKALAINIELGEGLSAADISVARADFSLGEDGRPRIVIHIKTIAAFDGELVLALIDESGTELGTSKTAITGAANETVLATFVFEQGSKASFPGVRHVLRKP